MKTATIDSYILPHLADIESYEPAEPIDSMAKRAGIPVEQIVRLNANENAYGPSPKVSEALAKLQVDPAGLDDVDHKVLNTIVQKFQGGPVGLETIAASISEEPDTVMDVYEPFLLQLGLLERTPRGRVATRRAYEHLGLPYKEKPGTAQGTLWSAGHDATPGE